MKAQPPQGLTNIGYKTSDCAGRGRAFSHLGMHGGVLDASTHLFSLVRDALLGTSPEDSSCPCGRFEINTIAQR